MRRVGLTLLLWAIALCASAQVRVGDAKVMELPDGTQLSFRLSGPIQYESFILNNPPRFVVDIANAQADGAGISGGLGSPDVRAVRTGVHGGTDLRIVLDLNAFVRSKSTLVVQDGHHLVVDIFRREALSPDIARVDVKTRPVHMISRAAVAPPTPPVAAPVLGAPRLTQHTTTPAPALLLASARPAVASEPLPTLRPAVERQVVKVEVPVPRPRPDDIPASRQGNDMLGSLLASLGNGREDTRPVPNVAIEPARAAAPTLVSYPPVAAPAPAPAPAKAPAPAPAPARPSTRAPSRDRIVVIDPGHGGKDPGAVGPDGTHEKQVVLSIARRLRDLINAEPGMRAVMTRDDDRFIRLYDRIAIARDQQADLFISIHADAIAGNPRAGGSSVYILSTSGSSSARARYLARRENEAFVIGGGDLQGIDESLREVVFDIFHDAVLGDSMILAENVIGELSRVGRVHRRKVERAGFAVLKSPDVPSVLVETAFISNPAEERNLKSGAFQQRMAEGILRGIRGFFKNRPPRDDGRQYTAANSSSSSGRVHVIQPGESLSAIAQRYQVPVAQLRSANNLHGDRVLAGSSLTIPFSLSGS